MTTTTTSMAGSSVPRRPRTRETSHKLKPVVLALEAPNKYNATNKGKKAHNKSLTPTLSVSQPRRMKRQHQMILNPRFKKVCASDPDATESSRDEELNLAVDRSRKVDHDESMTNKNIAVFEVPGPIPNFQEFLILDASDTLLTFFEGLSDIDEYELD